jgi:lipopolysaccharide assembly protein A
MGIINFLLIFAFCLAVALFSLENTESAHIILIPGVEFQAPLSVELIGAMGVGAILAWLFLIWTGLQRQISNFRERQQIRAKEQKIQALEEDVERWKAEVEKQHQLPSSTNAGV